MEESFRRAIRKMTGRSLLRLGVRPNRSKLEATLAQSMSANWSIALFEHLDAVSSEPETAMSGPEMISYSPSAWKLIERDFPKLLEEAREKFDEFRLKWKQRFSTDELHRMLLQGNWVVENENGWSLAIKSNKTEINNFYLSTVHLMVGDAEKLFVMLSSRVLHLQERFSKYWHEESALDAVSKILPCLEASFRKREETLMTDLRATLASVAKERFSSAFSTRQKTRGYSTSYACVRSVGRLWDPNFAYENAFLAYLEDFCDYAVGLCLLMAEWYRDKWSLFLRGFSRGQLDLFGSLQKTGTEA